LVAVLSASKESRRSRRLGWEVSGKRAYWVYIMTNRSGTLYIGVTNDLARRVDEHRQRLVPGFTSKYRINRLIHAESFAEVRDAIAREKQLKGWTRARKLALIAEMNPAWRDLGEEWFGAVGDA
jgi:putative endonuclease